MGDRNIKSELGLGYLRKARQSEVSEYWIRFEESKVGIHCGGDTRGWVIKEVKLGKMTLPEAREELKKFKEENKTPWFRCFELLKVEPVY